MEQEEQEVATALYKAEKEIEVATVERPTADQVQASWGALLDVWPELTEAERAELLSALAEE
ncbi:MAG TPA: hypothetical protein VFB21_05170 [Chthonomonadaceae bacterium]|nr:hypothetical protein [Chthonomonadaceae bacterium]